MFFSNIFYTKIIYAQRKTYWEPVVRPETGCNLDLLVSFFVHSFFEYPLG